MKHKTSVRLAALLLGTGGVMAGQFTQPISQKASAAAPLNVAPSTLPAANPTSIAPPLPASAPAATSPQKAQRRAEVSFTNGQLAVKADNSSLNQILREIGRQTGLKITGGVKEERVFGSYGPATTAEVLNSLLDGTGSNMLLIASQSGAPGELVLTPRLGGPTPPNPNAKGFDDDSDSDEEAPRTPGPRGVSLFGGAQAVEPAQTQPSAPPPSGPPVSPGQDASGAAGTPANPQSPNGVKTPQEIYQQLQQLRQQQQLQQQNQPPQ